MNYIRYLETNSYFIYTGILDFTCLFLDRFQFLYSETIFVYNNIGVIEHI